MISFSLSREIYGLTPWAMDLHTLPVMTSLLNDFRNGVKLEVIEGEKNNETLIYDVSNETRIITRPFGSTWNPGQLENRDDFSGIGVIKMDGPITKSGGASSYGMTHLSNLMLSMSKDERIKGFIILADSGGGASSAVQIMSDTINAVKNSGIPVYALIEKGSLACSACYGIISACSAIYTESGMNHVGSLGTMFQTEGRKANSQNPDGRKYIRLYATKSVKKNEAFEEALNNDNYQLIINDLLDPINEQFLATIATNRPQITETTYDDGKSYFAKDVEGTFTDGLSSFESIVEEILNNGSTAPPKAVKKNNFNNKTMNKEEIKSAHPGVYAEIVSEGVTSERDRVGAWMSYVEIDPKAVSEGIESGKDITATEREAFFVKQNSKKTAEELKNSSTGDLVTGESKGGDGDKKLTEAEKEAEAAFDFEMN